MNTRTHAVVKQAVVKRAVVKTDPIEADAINRRLLDWYDANRRRMPWRAEPGEASDPYPVWLSEIMLQQTQVATVIPYFEAFLARWPTVTDLAEATLDDVLHGWQGLGYYARARNMHKCAQFIADELAGVFPETEADLLTLPGIGPYTGAAIAAIAFGEQTSPVDGNVIRVLARLYAIGDSMPEGKQVIQTLADELTPAARPGDHVQALMDLGATVCTPRNPDCATCPWTGLCRAEGLSEQATYPVRRAKPPKPTRRGVVFWAVHEDGGGNPKGGGAGDTKSGAAGNPKGGGAGDIKSGGAGHTKSAGVSDIKSGAAVLLRRRPEKGLLGGMMEFPSTEWRDADWDLDEALSDAPASLAPPSTDWRQVDGVVRHTFTHFHLELTVLTARVDRINTETGVWCRIDDLSSQALPTVMKKVARLAAAEGAET